jgi:type III restriction enzyme
MASMIPYPVHGWQALPFGARAMSQRFFERSILNSPYECPTQNWELMDGIPIQEAVASRRESLMPWRQHQIQGIRPLFCQIEAAETDLWLTKLAPKINERGKDILEKLESANDETNPVLLRMGLKVYRIRG